MAILDNAVLTSSSPVRAALADSVCHPNLDTDCHVVELLAMTVIHLGVFADTISSGNMVALMDFISRL